MKKRITINVQPVDNGYTIQDNVADPNGQNQKSANQIAKDNGEVAKLVADFIVRAFTPQSETVSATKTPT